MLSKEKLLVFSTHILDQDEDFFDRILFLDDGQIIVEEAGYKIIDSVDARDRKQVGIIDLYMSICFFYEKRLWMLALKLLPITFIAFATDYAITERWLCV